MHDQTPILHSTAAVEDIAGSVVIPELAGTVVKRFGVIHAEIGEPIGVFSGREEFEVFYKTIRGTLVFLSIYGREKMFIMVNNKISLYEIDFKIRN